MLGVDDGAGNNGADEAIHRKVEGLVVVFGGVEVTSDLDIDAQLFFDLADAGLLSSLIRFELAAGEFPAALEFAISALAGETLLPSRMIAAATWMVFTMMLQGSRYVRIDYSGGFDCLRCGRYGFVRTGPYL